MLVYPRDGSAQRVLPAATLRYKVWISIVTPEFDPVSVAFYVGAFPFGHHWTRKEDVCTDHVDRVHLQSWRH